MTFEGNPEPVQEVSKSGEDPRGLALLGVVFAAIVPTFFSFGGWQQALWIGGEVRNPRRNVPVGITFTEGVSKRGMSLEHFVNLTSANAARLLGLYPRKGAIAPGSDADIVLIDPSIQKSLSIDDFHISDYSIWEGWEIQGWPVFTMLRGNVMVENGQLQGKLGTGQLIPRKIDSVMLTRPMCAG